MHDVVCFERQPPDERQWAGNASTLGLGNIWTHRDKRSDYY